MDKHFIKIVSIILLIVLTIYLISIVIGGGFHAFCCGAIIWVLIGICIASYFSYSNKK